MSPKLHEFAVLLQRDGQGTPWGIRLVGGNDLDTPLIITRVQVGSPSYGELLRGDIIAKIGEYDARDLSHADAQQLFRGAGNEIRLVVHRDNTIAYTQGVNQESGSGSNPKVSAASPQLSQHPHRGPSPFLPGPSHFERALQLPVDTLPQTVFPQLNASGGYVAPSDMFSPKPTRDYQQDVAEEQAAIINQAIG
ncbi:GH22527 [Drosophila grimshawi]|uniref:GH22527 n=1 Tax=Drosophila grimshawi TaxID=7222 RepID=B4K048_DROGR|nr:GH22527 [Drosophila grimshawi]